MATKSWDLLSLRVQSAFYVLAGLNHFWHREFYERVMPDHFQHPAALVYASGVAEVLGGVGLLLPQTRRFSAAGLCLMLVVFLDVHWFMAAHPDRFPELPRWLLIARIPMQFLLIGWALQYARAEQET
jgi:uncharacterized membrane protein